MHMNRRLAACTGLCALALFSSTGCDDKSAKPAKSAAAAQAALPDGFFMAKEPPGAKWVEEVKKIAKTGDTITVHGLVGGSKDPFVEGRAIVTLMGSGLKPCGIGSPMPECPTPWDYCCDPAKEIVAHSATIQVVDANGAPLRLSLKGRNNLKELSDLVVTGRVKQADGKLLVVNATGMFVRSQ